MGTKLVYKIKPNSIYMIAKKIKYDFSCGGDKWYHPHNLAKLQHQRAIGTVKGLGFVVAITLVAILLASVW